MPGVLYCPIMTNHSEQTIQRSFWLSARRAFAGRCPRCGVSPLFRSYLKPVDNCTHCGEAWSEIRADDAGPWLTILIVGHIIGPLLVPMARSAWFSPWEMAAILVPATLLLSLLILPRAKSVFIAAIWSLRASGS